MQYVYRGESLPSFSVRRHRIPRKLRASDELVRTCARVLVFWDAYGAAFEGEVQDVRYDPDEDGPEYQATPTLKPEPSPSPKTRTLALKPEPEPCLYSKEEGFVYRRRVPMKTVPSPSIASHPHAHPRLHPCASNPPPGGAMRCAAGVLRA